MPSNKILWRACCIAAIFVGIIGFTPLAIPQNIFQPKLLGIPYPLWVSILLSFLLVFLTFLGTKVHPGKNNPDEE
ncbi:MAG: hypothetical protein KTR26_06700 [Flammeovirgaceae bacterium]|nr:hypothetical protein [Flammeovirgaceae bacterium]